MAATIESTEVLKSINETMTVVRIDNRDGRTLGRVIFANTFGNVRVTRNFRDVTEMRAFVAQQRHLETDWRIANFVE